MTDLPDVKLRALTNFPVAVTGRTGIKVVKVGNKYYLDLDVSRLADATNIPADQVDQYEFTIHNKILDSYVNIPFAIGATAGVASVAGHTGLLDIGNGLGFTGDVLENLLVGFTVNTVATIADLKALNTTLYKTARLTAVGRAGVFAWTLGDYSAHVAADTNTGVYVKADAVPVSGAGGGAWVRQFNGDAYWTRWFGTVADHDSATAVANTAIINTIITTANLRNTLATPGKQAPTYIEIEGGVRFASENLSFLPSADYIFVYIRYYANSDTTKGVNDGAGGTNEGITLSVCSGSPGPGNGAMVGEDFFTAVFHPATGVNIQGQISGADAHLAAGSQVRIPTAGIPKRASVGNILDQKVPRFRTVYNCYGSNDPSNAVGFQTFNANIDINNVGTDGWPTQPAVGTVVTGVTSGAKGIKTSANATDLFVDWIHGTFRAGEKVTDGVTTSTSNVGFASDFSGLSNTVLFMGYNTPVLGYGVPPGYALTGVDFSQRLTLRGSTGSVGGANHKETVTNPGLLLTLAGAAVPVDANSIQLVLDNNKRAVFVDGIANGDGSTGRSFAQFGAAWCNFTNAAGVSANAGNVASVTRVGTGIYQVLFTNGLKNANYSVPYNRSNIADNFTVTGITTAGFNLNSFNSSNVPTDLVGTAYITVAGGI